MSYSIIKKPVALAGMDPIACLSRGGMPMPTPVPWGGVDIDCQLPGEPPQAASCRSYGGMWYRELGLCIPGTIPGGIPSFPATPYAPPPPANPYDQVAAQVCTATGGRYAGGICNYPQLGVTRTRSQLVDSEYEPPAGWTPPAGGCPQGQIGWPPACVPVPNTLPSIPTPPPTPGSCPAGTTWDAASGKCIAPAQLPPPGEGESEKQVAPAAQAEEKKLPSWVIPAVAGGAAFVILAALVMRKPSEMRANRLDPRASLQKKLHEKVYRATSEANRAARQGGLTKLQRAYLYTEASRLYGDASDMARESGLHDTAKKLEDEAMRASRLAGEWRTKAEEDPPRGWYGMRPNCNMRRNPPVELSYADLNVFQRYWWGQWDPLYAVLSRRGNSVSWVWVDASEEELERLTDVANEIIEKSDDKGEVRTAKAFLKRQK